MKPMNTSIILIPLRISFHLIECGRTFQENSASFTSPSYYSSMPSAEPESCEWRITATHGEKIVLNITDLVSSMQIFQELMKKVCFTQ